MPVGNVLVGNSGSYVEHNDTALSLDVVAVTKTTELLLASSVPYIELDGAVVLTCRQKQSAGNKTRWPKPAAITYSGEAKGVNLDTERRHVLLLKLSCQVTLDEGSLRRLAIDTIKHLGSNTSRTNEGQIASGGFVCKQTAYRKPED